MGKGSTILCSENSSILRFQVVTYLIFQCCCVKKCKDHPLGLFK